MRKRATDLTVPGEISGDLRDESSPNSGEKVRKTIKLNNKFRNCRAPPEERGPKVLQVGKMD